MVEEETKLAALKVNAEFAPKLAALKSQRDIAEAEAKIDAYNRFVKQEDSIPVTSTNQSDDPPLRTSNAPPQTTTPAAANTTIANQAVPSSTQTTSIRLEHLIIENLLSGLDSLHRQGNCAF